MTKVKINILPILFFLLIPLMSNGGQNPLDSIKDVLDQQTQADTLRLNTLITLGTTYLQSDASQGIPYLHMAYELAKDLGNSSKMALSKKLAGIGYYYLGDYPDAIREWRESRTIYDSIGDMKGVANMLSNIGAVYFNIGDNPQALETYLNALRVTEKYVDDPERLATLHINIGAVYFENEATHDKAMENYMIAYDISKELGDDAVSGTVTGNMGEYFMEKGKLDSALYYLKLSANYFKGGPHEAYPLNNIGRVYTRLGEYDKAIQYQQMAFALSKQMDIVLDMAQSKVALGNTFHDAGKNEEAVESFNEAIEIAKEINAGKEIEESYEGLSQAYSSLGEFDKAYQNHVLYTNIKDSLSNSETTKRLSVLTLTFDLEKKESQIQLLTKDKELQKAEIRRQRVTKNVTFGGLSLVASFLLVVLFQKSRITREKKRSEELLLNILPEEIAEELKEKGRADAQLVDNVTILFTDFKDFTKVSEKLSARELVAEINDCFVPFDLIMSKFGIEKIKTIGDAYMAASGLPVPTGDTAKNAILAAMEIQWVIEERRRMREKKGLPAFQMRVGIHTGSVVAGIVGVKKFQYDVWGDTVNTAARMESSGEPGKVNISQVTYELIKDDPMFLFTYRGKVEAKNKGMMDMYFVELKEDLHKPSHNHQPKESTTKSPLL